MVQMVVWDQVLRVTNEGGKEGKGGIRDLEKGLVYLEFDPSIRLEPTWNVPNAHLNNAHQPDIYRVLSTLESRFSPPLPF